MGQNFGNHRISLMKVVILTTYCRGKKIMFSTSHNKYEICDRDIDGKRSSNHPFQVSNIIFHIINTCGQQMLTKVGKSCKNGLFRLYRFQLKSLEKRVTFEIGYFGGNLSYRDIRYGIWKLRHSFWLWENFGQHLVSKCCLNDHFPKKKSKFNPKNAFKIVQIPF